jgi:hypothetical protein
MDISKTAIEKIKNVLIVVLVLSTILLLYFLWSDSRVGDFSLAGLGSSRAEPILAKSVLNPDKITVSFGAENYTVISSGAGDWDSSSPGASVDTGIIQELQAFSLSGVILTSAISKQDFVDVMRARSIMADFPFAMPFTEFCSQYGLRGLTRTELIESFTGVAYSEASPNSVFFFNKREERYYRLAADDADADFEALISGIERRGNASFYPLRMYSGIENEVMIPLDMQISMTPIPYWGAVSGMEADEGDEGAAMAQKLFGSSFDFTRKITEGNGTTVYMYGYGERVLVLNQDGSFEYSASGRDSNGVPSFFEALDIALDFISQHGALEACGMTPDRLYLSKVEADSDGGRGYRFSFGFSTGGYAVHYLNDEALVVGTLGDQATYFKQNLIDCQDVSGYPGDAPEQEALRPFDLLTENFAAIFDVLDGLQIALEPEDAEAGGEAALIMSKEMTFEAVVRGVSDVSAGYLRRGPGFALDPVAYSAQDGGAVGQQPGAGAEVGAGTGGQASGTDMLQESYQLPDALLPVWVFTVMGVDFYFDMYGGDMVGHTA